MPVSPSRKRLVVRCMLVSALAGVVLLLVSERRSPLYVAGQLLTLMWLPVLGNLLTLYYARPKRPRAGVSAPLPGFDEDAPFIAHAQVELDQFVPGWPDASGGEHRCLLLVGTEGFTTRLIAPAAHAGGALRVAVQFLSPERALTKLAPGASFRVVVGSQYVGAGRKLSPTQATAD